MKINDVKQYYVIYSLLDSDKDNPVTSNDLADELRISNKTVRNIISNIDEYCKTLGFDIMSKSGNGFYAKINDYQKVNDYKQLLDIYFSRNYVTDEKNTLLFSSFCLYIVNRSSPISIERLCDFFYLSKSTIYSYLGKAEKELLRSRIKMITDYHEGVSVQADESLKRFYTAFSIGCNVLQYDFENLYGEDFMQVLSSSRSKEIINGLLEKHNLSFDDEKYLVLLTYLSYSNYRYQRYHKLDDNVHLDTLKPLPEWSFAKELAQTLGLLVHEDENEIANITIFTLLFNTSLIHITEQRYGTILYKGIKDLFQDSYNYIQSFAPELCEISIFKRCLWRLSYHMFLIYHFKFNSKRFSNFFLFQPNNNVVANQLSRMYIAHLNKYFGEIIYHRYAELVCRFFHCLLYAAETNSKGMSLLLILKDRILFNLYQTDWLNTHLIPAPQSIDQLSLYEANHINLNKYDMIISDYPGLKVVQGKKVFPISNNLSENISIIDEYYRIAEGKSKTLNDFLSRFEYTFIQRDVHIERTDDFLLKLDNDLDGLGEVPIRTLRKLGATVNYMCQNKTLIIPYFYKNNPEDHENILSIYFNKNPYMKYSTLVFFSLQCDYSIKALTEIAEMCDFLLDDKYSFEKIAQMIEEQQNG